MNGDLSPLQHVPCGALVRSSPGAVWQCAPTRHALSAVVPTWFRQQRGGAASRPTRRALCAVVPTRLVYTSQGTGSHGREAKRPLARVQGQAPPALESLHRPPHGFTAPLHHRPPHMAPPPPWNRSTAPHLREASTGAVVHK